MVLRSTPVTRAISRWPLPACSSVAIVIRTCDFKTFNSFAPFCTKRAQRNVPPPATSAPTGVRSQHQGWGIFTRPQVEEVGWPPGEHDIRHVYIRPKTPRLNGKVERSHRVDEQEFYQLLDKDGIADDIHLFNDKLQEWEDYYNYHRPHGALDGQTPYEQLLARKASASVSPKS